MKNPTLIALATVTTCLAVDPVFTLPVGHVKLGNTTAGQDAVAANTDVNLAIPLEAEKVFTGQVDSTVTSPASITVQGTPGWTGDQWAPSPGTPYCVVINSGSENGLRGVITANGTDTLSITVTTPGVLANIASGDSIEIRKCWTLSTIFADATVPDNSVVWVYDESNSGINHSSSAIYLYFSGNWYDAVTFNPADDIVIHPGERFVFRSSGAAVPTLALFGDVPTSQFRLDLTKDSAAEEDIEIAHFNPTPETVGSLSIPAGDNDTLLIFDNVSAGINKSSSTILLSFGGVWYDAVTFADASSFELSPGQGFVLRRTASAPTSDTEWVEPAPYSAP